MIETSTDTTSIDSAILEFQGHISGVKRDATNPHFRSKYATLENVIDTARPALQECGLTFMQFPGAVIDGCLELATRLAHPASGQWILATMQMPLGKRDPQGTGSAQTYAMRYSLMAALGLPPTDDDDGNAAMGRKSLPEHLEPTKDGSGTKVKKGWSASGNRSSQGLKESGVWDEFQNELLECTSVHMLTKLALAWSAKAETDKWPTAWRENAKEEINKRRDAVLNSREPLPDDDFFPSDTPSNLHMAG